MTSSGDVVPVTVVLPTIGRPELIRACLGSLAACEPRAEEILVVDSSTDSAVEAEVSQFAGDGARVVRCDPLGLGTAFNVGLQQSRNELVLLTNDDCTVETTWVGVGYRHVLVDPTAIVTGRVRPRGDPDVVPSTMDDPAPFDHAGTIGFVLYTQCMALQRSQVLEFGGFDGRIQPSAEDNDLSYRWLRAGRAIHYRPDFLVWHHDWRTREQLERLYIGYGIGQGMLYGKHLRSGDLAIARFVLRDVYAGCRGVASRVLRGRPPHADWRTGHLRGLPRGLVRGWRAATALDGNESAT